MILPLAALLVFAVLAGFSNAHCYSECFPNNPPSIAGLPDQTVVVGQSIPLLDLWEYSSDMEDPDGALTFYIDSQSDTSVISCHATADGYIKCYPALKSGYSDIVVRATDTGGLYDTDTFRITVQSLPPANSCSDSDGGNVIGVFGTASGYYNGLQYSSNDYCISSGTIKEYYCSGNLESSQQQSCGTDGYAGSNYCLSGNVYRDYKDYYCSDGACSSTTTPTLQQACQYGCANGVCSSQPPVNTAPVIQGIQDFTISAGQTINSVDLYSYASDAQDPDTALSFVIDSESNTGAIDCYITGNRYVGCGAAQNAGYSDITVRATDTGGLYDTDTFRITVSQEHPSESAPFIDSINIEPSDPSENDDLTCNVDVSDPDSDLDRVEFKWYVEDSLKRTRTIDVSGSSDTAEDTLESGRFSQDDDVRCEAKVYERHGKHDSDSDSVTVGSENGNGECGVDVYNLEMISNNEIRFRIRNTGQDTESINYKVYVESEVIIEHSISLDEDEWDSIEETFSFDIRDSIMKVKAKAECGSTDTEFLSVDGDHGTCTAKYLDEYRCSGSWSQRKYQYSDCSSLWVNYESCSSGCSNGFCIGTGSQCAVSIQKFDYQTSIVAGNAAYVTLEARNTASRQETITLSLWVDGQLKESYPASVNPGSVSLRTFYYYPTAGTHQILAKAETNCGTSDTRTATVNVLQTGQPAPYPYPYPTPPAPSLPTAVSIYPSSVDTCLCDAKFITINIHNSVEQVYTIQVTGVPSEWVSYQSQTIVKSGDRQLFVYAGPKELGTHNMRIKVTAEAEKKSFEQDVSVFTAPCPDKPLGGDGITGSLIEAAKSPLFWIALIIIAGAVVIFIGATRLKPDEEFYEPAYPYRTYRPVKKSQTYS